MLRLDRRQLLQGTTEVVVVVVVCHVSITQPVHRVRVSWCRDTACCCGLRRLYVVDGEETETNGQIDWLAGCMDVVERTFVRMTTLFCDLQTGRARLMSMRLKRNGATSSRMCVVCMNAELAHVVGVKLISHTTYYVMIQMGNHSGTLPTYDHRPPSTTLLSAVYTRRHSKPHYRNLRTAVQITSYKAY
ncbi:hypothetical protein T440DRAFT_15031 [Plenodomus tracheiphilus IPT5]|uniref:Uncharacterized protein n=1 Tax=Plenodomus tracheiphilus IPT5 TaxID=1408161 RepID=A0A6A7BPX6_9PLEO|nr:hypothetical protein T440DRAFT_15031 [Plenodomus tracheiphilus IPT5]